ncbi:MAG: SH3 domain-containing protein [Cyanobacteria bacterium]|nr:SH3 domain-containing protein [Cyanobacteriota bacterium]
MVMGVLTVTACQPPVAPGATSALSPSTEASTAMDTSPQATNPANKSHVKEGNRDVSALKSSITQFATPQRTCTATAYIGNVHAAAVTLRQGPSNDTPVVGTVSAQEPAVVTVLGEKAPWLYITPGPGESGWIHSSLLAIQVRSAETSRPDGAVFLYTVPDASATAISEVAPGTEVPISGCSGSWLQVHPPGHQPAWLAPEHQCSNPLSACP